MGSTTRAPGGSYAYRASKAAVLNLGRNLATDLAPDGIAVSILHPGWVQTDMGGAAAEISPDAAARGILDRLDVLTVQTTGRFETRGRPIPSVLKPSRGRQAPRRAACGWPCPDRVAAPRSLHPDPVRRAALAHRAAPVHPPARNRACH